MRVVHLQPRLLRSRFACYRKELAVPVNGLKGGEERGGGREVGVQVDGFGLVETVGDELVGEGFEEGSDLGEPRGECLALC